MSKITAIKKLYRELVKGSQNSLHKFNKLGQKVILMTKLFLKNQRHCPWYEIIIIGATEKALKLFWKNGKNFKDMLNMLKMCNLTGSLIMPK